MKILIDALWGLALLSLTGVAAAQDAAPDVLVRQTTDEIVAQIRKDKELTTNPRKLLELVDAKVLPHFNFTRMTMLAVGRPWRDATAAVNVRPSRPLSWTGSASSSIPSTT